MASSDSMRIVGIWRRVGSIAAVLLIGGIAAFVGGAIAWRGVRNVQLQPWESGAFTAGPEMVLVVVAAVALGVIATILAWRWLVGPPLERIEWTLVFGERPPPPPATEGAEGAAPPTVGHLLSALDALGYTLDATITDEAGRNRRAADRGEPLAGRSLRLRERRVPEHLGSVLARIPPEREEGAMALGFLDAHGALDGPYEELARYVIAALGRLYPELTYKRMDSGLSEESAASMWGELPPRPERLGAK